MLKYLGGWEHVNHPKPKVEHQLSVGAGAWDNPNYHANLELRHLSGMCMGQIDSAPIRGKLWVGVSCRLALPPVCASLLSRSFASYPTANLCQHRDPTQQFHLPHTCTSNNHRHRSLEKNEPIGQVRNKGREAISLCGKFADELDTNMFCELRRKMQPVI